MELVVSIQNRESLATALDKGVGGGGGPICPRNPDSQVFSELADWRAAAREQKVKFYLTWDWLVRERELAGVPDLLAAVARLDPDGLQLRDLGLVREAPELSRPPPPGRRQLWDPTTLRECGWRPPWDFPGWWWRDPSA